MKRNLETRSRQQADRLGRGFKGGKAFLKGSDKDPAEAEDRTGDGYSQMAIDCSVLYHIGVQEAIKTLFQRES